MFQLAPIVVSTH